MTPKLNRLLDLVRRTGDRLVVSDPNGDDIFVLMGLDAYEALLKDPGVSAPPSPPPHPEVPPPHDIWDAMAPAGEGETWSPDDLTEEDLRAAGFASAPAQADIPQSEVSQPPQNREEKEVKTPEKTGENEEFGEEQFYLEPIE